MDEQRATAAEPTVLIVGDPSLGDRLGGGVGAPVVSVGNYLEAIGEMAHRPVGAIVGRLEPMRHHMEATVRAVRQVAPDAVMLLVVDAASEPEAMRAVRLGVDDYLVEPLRRGDLRTALAQLAETNAGLPVAIDIDSAATEAGSGAPDRGGPPATPEAAALDDDDASGSPAARASLEPAGFEGLTEMSDRWIERLLSERGTVRDVMLEDLRRRLDAEATWAAEPALDAASCVPVIHGEQTFGYLVSEAVDNQSLSAEADRLGRWLALEARLDELKHVAMHDELTGVWNRRYFDRFLESVLRRAREQRFRVTLMLFDIDDFKHYNDEYGHAAGDDILREAARLMTSVVRRHDVVARIGGDEFAVIFWDADPPRKQRSHHPASVRKAASRFRQAICDHRFPKLADLAPDTLTVSGGLASYPWDGQTPEALTAIADDMLLRSKRQGKNVLTFGPGAIRLCHGERGEADSDPPAG